mgnify:CR=1 FL=1
MRTWMLLYSLLCLVATASVVAAQMSVDTEVVFDGWQRNSVYISVHDGTRLALDFYRPTRQGQLHQKPLPVVWRFTPYGRYPQKETNNPNALPQGGAGINGPKAFAHLLRQGYVVAQADVRGYAASFGSNRLWLGPQEGRDAYDITEWLAAQPWSDGNIGMMGLSYLASVQYLAAAEKPPHLKAIFAAMGQFDHYSTFLINGIFRADLPAWWRLIRAQLDLGQGTPVAADADGTLLQAAVREHFWNRDIFDQMRSLEFRDDSDSWDKRQIHLQASPWTRLKAIEESGVAIYHFTGWFDAYGKHQLLYFANLKNPQKILLGPYFHKDHFGIDLFAEAQRWFDYWLKGQDNGIMAEPPVRYFVVGEAPESGWKTAQRWPLPNEQRNTYYFSDGPSGSIESVNDGGLSLDSPAYGLEKDSYSVDYTLSLGAYVARNNGTMRRCDNKTDVEPTCYRNAGYPDLSQSYDVKALTYTSPPLTEATTIAGHPLVRFWASASTPDADFFVVLEEVDSHGRSHFVTDNAIRASHRTINVAPFNHLNLPWLGHYRKDAKNLGPQPAEIVLDLKPVANLFEAGHRIRVTIAGADVESGAAPWEQVAREITLYHGQTYPSSIELPVIP